jgi:hypothetical protein
LGITEAQALLWETKSLKQIADYLLILYPKDITTKSDTLQRITAWKLEFDQEKFNIMNTVGEEAKFAQLFDIEALATTADLMPANQQKFAKILMSKIPKDSRLYTAILDLPADKQPNSIKTWIRAVSLARQKGRELIKEAAAWQPSRPPNEDSKGERKRRYEEEQAAKKRNRGDNKQGNAGREKDGPTCNACGYLSYRKTGPPHTSATCFLSMSDADRKAHPDINPDPAVLFKDSINGKAWATNKNGPTVHPRFLLNGAPFDRRKYPDTGKKTKTSQSGHCELFDIRYP